MNSCLCLSGHDLQFAVLWADYKRCVGQGGSDSWRENMLHFYVWVNHMHVTLPSDYHWPGLGLEVVAPHVRYASHSATEWLLVRIALLVFSRPAQAVVHCCMSAASK